MKTIASWYQERVSNQQQKKKEVHNKSFAMLQTRRSPLRPLSAGLAAVVLLYCSVYLTAAQPPRTCTNTAHAASAAAKTEIYDHLKDGKGVCLKAQHMHKAAKLWQRHKREIMI